MDVDSVNQNANITSFDPALYGENYYSSVGVEPCRQYLYKLTAITLARHSLDVAGSFETRCEVESVEVDRRDRDRDRDRGLQRSIEWNSLQLRSTAGQQTDHQSLTLIMNFALALVLQY